MDDNYIKGIEETVDENGMRIFNFIIGSAKKKNYCHSLMIDGIQIVSGAALAACTWKLDISPTWPIDFVVLVIEGAFRFYWKIEKRYRKLPYHQKERLVSSTLLATGTTFYFAHVVKFSRNLKQDNKLWIAYLGGAATYYYLSVSSHNRLGRTVLDRKPLFKCFQLLFGPTLIGSAAYYLLSFQEHEEEWLRCLPLIASAAAASTISFSGYRRVESNNEPRWLLFKGLELIVGGSILYINGALLVVYGVGHQFNPFLILLFTFMIFSGASDIRNSLKTFKRFVQMEPPVFYCICQMIGGPMIFFSACLTVANIDHPLVLPAFIVIAGYGLNMLGNSVIKLQEIVPPITFNKYCQQVLGPVTTVYSSLVSAYIGYHMGWKFSMVMIPLIPFGIYATYKGWQ